MLLRKSKMGKVPQRLLWNSFEHDRSCSVEVTSSYPLGIPIQSIKSKNSEIYQPNGTAMKILEEKPSSISFADPPPALRRGALHTKLRVLPKLESA